MSMDLMEQYFQTSESKNIKKILIQNYDALLEGRFSINDEIGRNITRYLVNNIKYRLGISTRILVKTKDQKILYPQFSFSTILQNGTSYDFDADSDGLNYVETAADNYNKMTEGLDVMVDVELRHNSWLSNGILLFWVFLSSGVFYVFIRRKAKAEEAVERERIRKIEDLTDQLNQTQGVLGEASEKERDYQGRIEEIRRERDSLSHDVDGLLEEMTRLEKGVLEQQGRREEAEIRLLELTDEVDRLKGKLRRPKKKEKEIDLARKRISALYKNVEFTDRFFEGLIALSSDFQLRVEEILQVLNQDAGTVAVKRKVFGKGGKTNILETEFAYSGRLYFERADGAGVRVLAVGTKNSQTRDLSYLESYRAGK